jgi:hypothetical protein
MLNQLPLPIQAYDCRGNVIDKFGSGGGLTPG